MNNSIVPPGSESLRKLREIEEQIEREYNERSSQCDSLEKPKLRSEMAKKLKKERRKFILNRLRNKKSAPVLW